MNIYESYNYGYNTSSTNTSALLEIYSATITIISLVISIITIISLFKIFKKFGKPGWYSLIPFLNMWTLFKIVELPGWFCLIPFLNTVSMYITLYRLAKKYQKSTGFAFCTVLFSFVCLPILAFTKDNNQEQNLVPNNIINSIPVSNTTINQTVNKDTVGYSDSLTTYKGRLVTKNKL